MCRARGFEPATRPDPYPDLGLQAVREGLGVVVYVRGAFPPELPGSAFVPVEPAVAFPFSLAWRPGPRAAALDAVLRRRRGVTAAAGSPRSASRGRPERELVPGEVCGVEGAHLGGLLGRLRGRSVVRGGEDDQHDRAPRRGCRRRRAAPSSIVDLELLPRLAPRGLLDGLAEVDEAAGEGPQALARGRSARRSRMIRPSASYGIAQATGLGL